jgi:hypothetical protein
MGAQVPQLTPLDWARESNELEYRHRPNHSGSCAQPELNRCGSTPEDHKVTRAAVRMTNADDPQLDEEVWQEWVRKNEAKDRVQAARRKKLLAIVLILGIAVMILWKIAG